MAYLILTRPPFTTEQVLCAFNYVTAARHDHALSPPARYRP